MNFAFKSTFQCIIKRLIAADSPVRRAFVIIAFNATLTISGAYAYLSNSIIPATIGSRYYGHHYVAMLKVAACAVVISTAYAIAVMIKHFLGSFEFTRYRISDLRIKSSSLKQ